VPKKPFFSDGDVIDIGYRNVRDADDGHLRWAREECEALWEIYEPYADPEFLVEVTSNLDARYWEMYLTVFLIKEGHKVVCPKPGPDVGFDFKGRRIWIEATSPTVGADGTPDKVPEMKFDGVMRSVPNEQMILRYLNSISEKYQRQYVSWIDNKIVSPRDAFIIAINPRRLRNDIVDTDPPRILQVGFMVGNPYMAIDRKTAETVETGYQFRNAIAKKSGSTVSTGVFENGEYCGLSGLLCSRVDAANHPEDMGQDFQLVPNPHAKVQLPKSLRLKGTYYRIARETGGYTAHPERGQGLREVGKSAANIHR
jgi:hypothetical protein